MLWCDNTAGSGPVHDDRVLAAVLIKMVMVTGKDVGHSLGLFEVTSIFWLQ